MRRVGLGSRQKNTGSKWRGREIHAPLSGHEFNFEWYRGINERVNSKRTFLKK
jgi:hypothetical protein